MCLTTSLTELTLGALTRPTRSKVSVLCLFSLTIRLTYKYDFSNTPFHCCLDQIVTTFILQSTTNKVKLTLDTRLPMVFGW